MEFKLKRDRFRKSRGGSSRLLTIFCESCGKDLFYYQKDGPGILKRLYLDRIQNSDPTNSENLICPNCKDVLGVKYIYEKESRPAFRLFVGKVGKKIVKKNRIR